MDIWIFVLLSTCVGLGTIFYLYWEKIREVARRYSRHCLTWFSSTIGVHRGRSSTTTGKFGGNSRPYAAAGKIGLAIVIANQYEGVEKLNGPAKDKERWEKTFKYLKFDVRTSEKVGLNASKGEMLRLCKLPQIMTIKQKDVPNYRYIAFVFSGHGYKDANHNDVIVSQDGKSLSLESEVFPCLFGGRRGDCIKLIFIDACRSDPSQEELALTGSHVEKAIIRSNRAVHVAPDLPTTTDDAFIAFATLKGLSAEDTAQGSVFSSSFTKWLKKDISLVSAMMKVTEEVNDSPTRQYYRPMSVNMLSLDVNLYKEAKLNKGRISRLLELITGWVPWLNTDTGTQAAPVNPTPQPPLPQPQPSPPQLAAPVNPPPQPPLTQPQPSPSQPGEILVTQSESESEDSFTIPPSTSYNPVKTKLQTCYRYLRGNLPIDNDLAAKLFGWEPQLLDRPNFDEIRALNEHGKHSEAFQKWYQFAESGYTKERLRVFCECLEEAGKDARPKLIEVAKEIRKLLRGEDVLESESNVSFVPSSSQSGDPPLLGSQQNNGSMDSVTDGIHPDGVPNGVGLEPPVATLEPESSTSTFHPPPSGQDQSLVFQPDGGPDTMDGIQPDGVPDGVGLEPPVTTLEPESSTSTFHPPPSGQNQSLVFQPDGGPDTMDGIQPDGVPDGVGLEPPVATLEPESSTSTFHPPPSGQNQSLVFQPDGGPDTMDDSHLVHQAERDGPLVKSEDDVMAAHSSEPSRLCATDKPTEKELCTHVTTKQSIIRVWEKVCGGVGVSQHEIEAVKRDHSVSPLSEVFFQCLHLWREGRTEHTKPVTWETLLTALAQAGLNDEAKHIRFNVLKFSDPLTRKPTVMELQEHIIGSKTLRILQWETVCRLLGVESKEIESVKRDHPNDNVGAFRECLLIWHKRSSGVTWERLLEAVEKAGERELVSEVKRKLGGAYMPKGLQMAEQHRNMGESPQVSSEGKNMEGIPPVLPFSRAESAPTPEHHCNSPYVPQLAIINSQGIHHKTHKDPDNLTIRALMPYIGELASLGLQISGWLDMSNEWVAISKTPGRPVEHLQQLLIQWLNGEEDPDVPHTWKHFIGVVRNCKRGKLAEKMEREVFGSQQPSLPSSQRSQPPPPRSVQYNQCQNPSAMYGYDSYVPGQRVPQHVDHPHGQYHSYVAGSGQPVPPPVEEQPGLKVQASDPQHTTKQSGRDSYIVPFLPHIHNPYNRPTGDIPANPWHQYSGQNPPYLSGGQNPSFQHGGQNPSFQHGGQNPSFQHGGQNPAFQHGGQNPAFQHGGQNPSFQHGGQNPAFQHGGQNPAFQHGGQNPAFQHGGQNPAFQHGGQNPSFQHGGQNLTFQHGGQNLAFQHGGQNPSFQHGGPNPAFQLGGQNPSFQPGWQHPSYSSYAASMESTSLDSRPKESDIMQLVGSKMSADWDSFAMFLGFEGNTRRTIEMDSMRMTGKCFMNAVTLWLQGRHGTGDLPRTWRSIIQAVRDSGHGGLADDVCRSLPRDQIKN